RIEDDPNASAPEPVVGAKTTSGAAILGIVHPATAPHATRIVIHFTDWVHFGIAQLETECLNLSTRIECLAFLVDLINSDFSSCSIRITARLYRARLHRDHRIFTAVCLQLDVE